MLGTFINFILFLLCLVILYCCIVLQRSFFMEIERMRRFIVEHSKLYNYDQENKRNAESSAPSPETES